jgi:hypothetical protein
MTNAEAEYIAESIKQLAANHEQWLQDYNIDLEHQKISPRSVAKGADMRERMEELLELPLV